MTAGNPIPVGARFTDAAALAPGPVLVTVPHMDDEVLGCGGLLAALPDKHQVTVVYLTSGRGSENLAMPGVRVDASIDMGAVRRRESLNALARLGLAEDQAVFLDVPDYGVARDRARVRARLADLIASRRPATVLTPFRYDRHTDHVALSRIVRELLGARSEPAHLLEYFVYYRWKMLPAGDVRRYIRPAQLVAFDPGPAAAAKREALACFTSQITNYFPWQTRPVLSAELLDEVCAGPEIYLRAPPRAHDAELYTLPPAVIHAVHTLEPWLKRNKDRLRFLCARRTKRA